MGSVGERLCDGMCAQLRCILVAASKHRPASPQCAHSLHLQGPEWDGGSRGKVSVWDNGLIHVVQTGTAGQLASGKMQLSQECLPHPVQPAGWEALSLTITHAISPTPSMCVFASPVAGVHEGQARQGLRGLSCAACKKQCS